MGNDKYLLIVPSTDVPPPSTAAFHKSFISKSSKIHCHELTAGKATDICAEQASKCCQTLLLLSY